MISVLFRPRRFRICHTSDMTDVLQENVNVRSDGGYRYDGIITFSDIVSSSSIIIISVSQH